ncbi:MAG: carboxypeptidase C (cathepsin A) [Planctomycetota bacterium]
MFTRNALNLNCIFRKQLCSSFSLLPSELSPKGLMRACSWNFVSIYPIQETTMSYLKIFSQTLLFAGLALTCSTVLTAQEPTGHDAQANDKGSTSVEVVADRAATSEDSVTINGRIVPYRVTIGTQPVWDEDGEAVAAMFYSFYERTDIEDKSTRPLVFSFNGGPGSASVWMHLAYTGPRILKIDDEGYPVQPYGVQSNPHSILDVADIVFIDPVNTGFSRIVGDADRAQFFGVNEDIRYLARWLGSFVTRQGRWTSPKYLIGESYGTTRVSGLAGALQSSEWMYLNGVVLVSPTGLGIKREGPVRDALYLPYFAATAWYHKQLAPELQAKDLDDLLPEVEAFTLDELLPALARGGSLSTEDRERLSERYARYSGLDVAVVRRHDMAISTSFFWKELLRDEGLTVGRLDSRYRGLDRSDSGTSPDFDPALSSWNHAFSPAINHYLREVLGYETDLQYWLFGPVHPWNRDGDRTGQTLQRAMAQNPFLHVLVQSGYYDGGTDYFNAKYTMWGMDPAGRFGDRMSWKGYRSGHMMYLRKPDLKLANDDIREFIKRTMPAAGEAAKR